MSGNGHRGHVITFVTLLRAMLVEGDLPRHVDAPRARTKTRGQGPRWTAETVPAITADLCTEGYRGSDPRFLWVIPKDKP